MCMFETVLHTGAEHPDLWWTLLPSLFSFVVGLGLGSYSDRLRNWANSQTEPTME